jgi:hypothetical protein
MANYCEMTAIYGLRLVKGSFQRIEEEIFFTLYEKGD